MPVFLHYPGTVGKTRCLRSMCYLELLNGARVPAVMHDILERIQCKERGEACMRLENHGRFLLVCLKDAPLTRRQKQTQYYPTRQFPAPSHPLRPPINPGQPRPVEAQKPCLPAQYRLMYRIIIHTPNASIDGRLILVLCRWP